MQKTKGHQPMFTPTHRRTRRQYAACLAILLPLFALSRARLVSWCLKSWCLIGASILAAGLACTNVVVETGDVTQNADQTSNQKQDTDVDQMTGVDVDTDVNVNPGEGSEPPDDLTPIDPEPTTDDSDTKDNPRPDDATTDDDDKDTGNDNDAGKTPPDGKTDTRVRFTTTLGAITMEMNTAAAPVTVANFLQYVEDGFYDGADGLEPTTFHRIVPGFVVQGGGLTTKLVAKETRDPIINEANNGLLNLRGTVSMARTNEPDSATSQFFISLVDNPGLDRSDPPEQNPGFAVFATVIEGMDVVDAMAEVKTTTVPPFFTNVPQDPIIITSAKILPPK